MNRAFGWKFALVVGAASAGGLLGLSVLREPQSESPRASVPAPPAQEPALPQVDDAPYLPAVARQVPFSAKPTPAADLKNLRALVRSNPARALELLQGPAPVEEGEVEERIFLEAEALMELERVGDARGRAREYYESYPEGEFTEQLVRLTGLQPRPGAPR